MSGIITSGINRSSGLLKAAASGGNTPMFMAIRGLDSATGDDVRQLLDDAAYDKCEFNQVTIDTDSCYDASNFRFTPNVAGHYFLECNYTVGSYTDRHIDSYLFFRKNGGTGDSILAGDRWQGSQSSGYTYDQERCGSFTAIEQFNGTTDYVEVWAYYDVTVHTGRLDGGNSASGRRQSYFQGFRLGE